MGQLVKHIVPSYVVGSGHGRRTQGVTRLGLKAGGGIARSSLFLAFNNLGAGAVDTMESRGQVTPTFTRATTAWAKLASGLWGEVASGVARYSFNGANTAVSSTGGYFAEGQRTNLTLQNRDMTQAVAWTAVNITPAKTGTGIDGVVNSGSRLTCTSNGGTILQVLVAGAASRTYSAWIRRVTGTGTISLFQGATTSDITAQINSSTYTRVELNASVDVSVLGYGIIMATSGDVIEVDMNGYEAATFASSPIPTTVATVTRNADDLTYPLTGWYIQTQGTIFVSGFYGAAVGVNEAIAEIDDGTNTNRHVIFRTATTALMTAQTDVTATQASIVPAGAVTNAATKVAYAFATNSFQAARDSILGTEDTSGSLPTVTTLRVGNTAAGTAGNFNPISRIAYYPYRMSNGQLQAITA